MALGSSKCYSEQEHKSLPLLCPGEVRTMYSCKGGGGGGRKSNLIVTVLKSLSREQNRKGKQ